MAAPLNLGAVLMALTSLMSFQLSFLKALNDNAAAIQAITTMVLVGVTAWYVYLTRQMLQPPEQASGLTSTSTSRVRAALGGNWA